MARITLGIGTSHGPLTLVEGKEWVERGQQDKAYDRLNTIDGRFLTYPQLVAERGEPYGQESSLANLTAQAKVVFSALDYLERKIEEACPDVVIVIGDDQGELFGLENNPALSIFYGDDVLMHPLKGEFFAKPYWDPIKKGYAMDKVHSFPGHPEFARYLIEALIERHVDVGAASHVPDPEVRGFGHAFGFIANRLFGNKKIPMVPILLNTYFQPNAPRADRCYEIGCKLAAAINQAPFEMNVVIVASGGLSHFLCEEELDLKVLAALRNRDLDTIRSIPKSALLSGSSEILNWIMAGGALEHLKMDWSEYVPVRRTAAGTGIGMAFATWT